MNVTVDSGHPLLAKAAVDAVKQWIYPPIILDGKVVEAVFPLVVNFTLNQEDDGASRPDHLVEQGEELSPEEAKELEQGLLSDPDNATSRAKLLGYYTVATRIAERRQTLAWFVSHDPSSIALMTSDAALVAQGNSMADPEGYKLLKSLWLHCAEVKSFNRAAWQNAVSFLESQDKPEAEKILLDLENSALHPTFMNAPPEVRQLLAGTAAGLIPAIRGELYARAIMGVVGKDDSGRQIFDSAEANSEFAHKAKGELASSHNDDLLRGAFTCFSEYNKNQDGRWDAILAEIERSRAALAGK